MAAAWGGLAGGLLQFLVQLPAVLRLDREIRIGHGRDLPPFQEALRNAGPAILGRGVVQLSSYIDLFLGSLLAIGAVARLRYAQTLYVLPVSLFGASTAAAELPELARERSGDHEALRTRVVAAVRRVSFFVVPSFVAFVLLGDVLVAGIYRAGAFGAADVTIVWLTLAAYGFGLLASTTTRVYQSAFFALRDTKTPARVAALRMVASAVAGFALMVQFEPIALAGITVPGGIFSHWRIAGAPLGPVGLAVGATLGAWLEWTLLHASLASVSATAEPEPRGSQRRSARRSSRRRRAMPRSSRCRACTLCSSQSSLLPRLARSISWLRERSSSRKRVPRSPRSLGERDAERLAGSARPVRRPTVIRRRGPARRPSRSRSGGRNPRRPSPSTTPRA